MSSSWTARLAAHPSVMEARRAWETAGRLDITGLAASARLLLPLLLTERPLLVCVAHEKDVEQTAEDLRTLAAATGAAGSVLSFPAPGPLPYRGLPRHGEASLRRSAALRTVDQGRARALVASPAGLLRPTLPAALFETRVLALRAGEEMTPELLLEALDESGYRREDPVTAPGQVARRGGIVDLFPPDRDAPVRLEFAGDTLETIRSFDVDSQRRTAPLTTIEVLPLTDSFAPRSVVARMRELLPLRFAGHRDLAGALERIQRGPAAEELSELLPLVPGASEPLWDRLFGWAAVALEPETVLEEAEAFHERAREERQRRPETLALEPEEALVPAAELRARLAQAPALHLREVDPEARGLHLAARPVNRYAGDLRRLSADLRNRTGAVVLLLGNAGRAARLEDVLREDGLSVGGSTGIEIGVGALSRGFEMPAAALQVLADGDVFPEEVHLHPRGRRTGVKTFLSDFRDLKVGDLVVHEEHGIGRFLGLETLEVAGAAREFMVLGYQAGDKLKVPVENFDRVQKYSGVEGARPAIDRLGSGRWEKVKRRVKKAMRDMAAELLKLYAERKARPGHAFSGESPWQREFEESFEYEETADQAAAIAEVAADMSSDTPMDRLVCGDVGYGKTEVAMRAAMRAVLDGKQVALLAPTTVLAFQHWKTLRKRFAPFPVMVEMVSRFRSARDIKDVLGRTARGQVDVLVGTHRLLSRDVAFRDLGLLVIDEEQRFGVAAKERLKQMRRTVDCLTLSATPIPRTLQMGLAGIRDMSVIETAPKDRLAIQTAIVKFSTDVIAAAIRQELARDGQVFFVHNRVESIWSVAAMVQKLVPEARVAVAHGQMPEGQLEKTMLAFVEGRVDVLVATTIIENGLDIPRANTLIVNRADRYGLAQLYQLRGRVGRSDRLAYAYLLVPPEASLSEVARKRLAAIREFSELGAGFRIAALDLELRGAGNLLGGEQSGHIEAVGLDLYVKLLEQTVLELKGEAPPEAARASLNLRIDLRIPPEYVPEAHQRMSLYKRISQVRDEGEVRRLRDEVRDRYGPLPPEMEGLLGYAALRLWAEALGIQQVDRSAGALQVRFGPEPPLGPEDLVRAVRALPGASVLASGALRVPSSGPGVLAELQALLAALEAARSRGREQRKASGL